jgi:NAD-dependent dihydropyrimidine dehydrogenase PreA subunit
VREVIEIDEGLCDGCGECATACAEGAIAIIDGKARLISDVYCDGLGACLGHCPQGAITVIQREAANFDQDAVEHHLKKLRMEGPASPGTPLAVVGGQSTAGGGGCPGSRVRMHRPAGAPEPVSDAGQPSQLRHWPVQLQLVPPTAPFFRNQNVLLVADCVAFAVGDFHQRFLAGSSLAIACPKLDSNQAIYLQKLITMIDEGGIAKLTVVVMEVPCCGGLVRLAEDALRSAGRRIPTEAVVVGTQGHTLGQYRITG